MATRVANEKERGGSRKLLQLAFMPTLAITLTVTIVVTAIVTTFINSNFFGPDLGWSVFTSEVKSERKVSIHHDLEVSKDIKLGGQGSVVEMTGVNCKVEPRSVKGSGRLCFDAAGVFMISENGGEFVPLAKIGLAGKDGVPGQNGAKGKDGSVGRTGADGRDGINCWDTNGNGKGDVGEDTNFDQRYTARDCIPFRVE